MAGEARERVPVRKTYKLFIGGAFPRSESGRSFPALDGSGNVLARVARASRKDVRDAVRAARGAFAEWSGKTAYNRGQILYRIAEILEGRRDQLHDECARSGVRDADHEVDVAVDRWVWYAGWCDKVHQVAGGANAVAGPYFNFTVPEPTGVVAVIAPDDPPLLGLISRIAPALAGGNTVVALASERGPLPALTLGEILATSDVPAGTVNLLTGYRRELVPWMAGHMDVNAIDVTGVADPDRADLERAAAENVKRVVSAVAVDLMSREAQSPYEVIAFMEMKTVWHPMGA